MGIPLPTRCGNCLVADHLKFNKRDEAVVERSFDLGIMDRYTGWSDGLPSVGKAAEVHVVAFRHF